MAFTTIDDPEAHFQTVLYTGDGAANNAITLDGTTDMQPDFVWIKNRGTTDVHCMFDSARGATKLISSDSTAAESTDADTLDSFTSDGFQVDADVKVNTDGENYVAWCWKGGTTSGIATDGDTDTTPSAYSFNQTAGISLVTYAGAAEAVQLAHGLGAVPHFTLHKTLSQTGSWGVYHHNMNASPEDFYQQIDTQLVATDNNTWWNDTAPDSVNMTLGTEGDVNYSGRTYGAMMFSEKQGFSKFGKYIGNGNADGPMVYTGFKPAFLMIKSITDAGDNNWHMMDNKRIGFNRQNYLIQADLAIAEETAVDPGQWFDFLSNGFRPVSSTGSVNSDGAVYTYVAFAESPFVNSNGVPNNAR